MKDINIEIPMDNEVISPPAGKLSISYKHYFYGVLVLLWVLVSFMTVRALASPVIAVENIIENTIEIKTIFNYSGIMKPSVLYPAGGKTSGDEVIFTKLTDKLIINLVTNITAKKPVKIEGTAELIYTLTAKDMWHKDYVVTASQPIQSQGLNHSLLKEDVTINLQQLFDLISKIEEETNISLGDYQLVLKPRITGNVYQEDGEKICMINSNLEIPFYISSQYIKYEAESPEKEFVESKIIENSITRPEFINAFGFSIPVMAARYIFGLPSLVLSVFILIGILRLKQRSENKSETDKIDRKYKHKIVNVSNKIDNSSQLLVSLNSFKALLQIAEDKDEPILKYKNSADNTAVYYVISAANVVYCYEAADNVKSEVAN